MTGRGLRLLDWRRVDKGALVGWATIMLPSGLQITDIGIFQRGDDRWASLPSEQMRDPSGQVIRDERGKVRYRSPLKWSTRELQEGFSRAVIEAIETAGGPL
jgi:hypothetical protein